MYSLKNKNKAAFLLYLLLIHSSQLFERYFSSDSNPLIKKWSNMANKTLTTCIVHLICASLDATLV